jgi:glutamine amidotransferase
LIAIVDYGVGNVRSVERALAHVGAEPKLTADPDDLERADGLVLPGVGAFAPALEKLSENGLGKRIVELARNGKPLLGVCLGYQLLFEESMEHGRHEGLGLLPGKVVEVKDSQRLPVIGWCRLAMSDAIAWSEFSPAAAAVRGNVMGTQFHPEKSGPDGLRIYKNFVAFCS